MHEVRSPRGPNAAARQSSKVYALWNERLLMTVADAAKALGLADDGARWLAISGQLRHERTVSGQYIFRWADVKDLLLERAERRLAPPRTVRDPQGQVRLPFARVGRAARLRPASWTLGKFTPRMLRVGLRRNGGDQRAEGALHDRGVKAAGNR